MIGEIQSGLWIGGLTALKEIPKVQCGDDSCRSSNHQNVGYDKDDKDDNNNNNLEALSSTCCIPSWTIVSLVHSPKLTQFCQTSIAELQNSHPSLQNNNMTHIEWHMADKVDSPLLCQRLVEILAIIDKSMARPGHHILVHCAFGVSRSVSVCAAWLMSRQGMSVDDALGTIRAVRPDAMPNWGFLATLRTIQRANGDIEKAIERKRQLLQPCSSDLVPTV